jgi:hypothetical protein
MEILLKILAVWVLFDLFVFLPLWIAAKGGVKPECHR